MFVTESAPGHGSYEKVSKIKKMGENDRITKIMSYRQNVEKEVGASTDHIPDSRPADSGKTYVLVVTKG